MNGELLKKYLDGRADEAESQLCEDYLRSNGRFDEGIDEAGDSLLETLRLYGSDTLSLDGEAAEGHDGPLLPLETEELLERIRQLVPLRELTLEDRERILSPTEHESALGTIGKYVIDEYIATGGMGVVFKATDPDLNRSVCVKVLHPALASRPSANDRFLREAQAASGLQHERIVAVLDVGEHRDLPYLVMELLEGKTLRQHLMEVGPLDGLSSRSILRQTAEGLRYAHDRGFLHRDIKPDNLWMTRDGNVKILDFGLARAIDESIQLTHTGTIVGTPRYMSPEQVQGRVLAPTSDLFSLGSVAYEMTTGTAPFERETVFATMMAVANDPVEDAKTEATEVPSLDQSDPELASVIGRLLSKDPKDRPQSANELLDELSLEQETIAVGSARWSRVRTFAVGLIAGLLLASFTLLLFQATDRGTLVMEVDPSIELQVKDDLVTIHDPETDRRYRVKIGAQPVAGGTYLLELSDASGDFTLSSEIITIRRGQKQVVRLELKQSIDSPSDVDGQSILDNAVPPERFDLADLPPLTSAETQRTLGTGSGSRLSYRASVVDPAQLPSTSTWTIEPEATSSIPDHIEVSGNGQRILMGGSDGFVRVFNSDLKLSHLVPASDVVTNLSWSPNPDVFAMLCQGPLSREALVWRLKGNRVELLLRIPIQSSRAVWSQTGEKIAFQTESGIQFYDIRKQQAYAIPNAEIFGEIAPGAWSADGRMFVVRQDDIVKVWDLETGQGVHIFPSAIRPRFLDRQNHLLVHRSQSAASMVEIWDMETLARLTARSIPDSWIKSTLTFDKSGTTLAVLTSEGELVVGRPEGDLVQIDLIDEDETKLTREHANQNVLYNLSQLELDESGQGVMVRLYRDFARFSIHHLDDATQASIHRDMKWVSPFATWSPQVVAMNEAGTSITSMEQQLDGRDLEISLHYQSAVTLDRKSVDLRFEPWTIEEGNEIRPAPVEFAFDRIGKHVALIDVARSRLLVYDLSTQQSLFDGRHGDGQLTEFHWTEDGTKLVLTLLKVGASRRTSREVRYEVFDVESEELTSVDLFEDFPNVRQSTPYATLGNVYKNYLIVPFAQESGRERLVFNYFYLAFYDLNQKRRVGTMRLGVLRQLHRFQVANGVAWWLGERQNSNNIRSTNNSRHYVQRFDPNNLPQDFETDFENGETLEIDDSVTWPSGVTDTVRTGVGRLSADGKFLYFYSRSNGSTSRRTFIVPVASIEALQDKSSTSERRVIYLNGLKQWQHSEADSGVPRDFISPDSYWHPLRNHVVVDRATGCFIYDAESDSEIRVPLGNDLSPSMIATSFGWVSQERQQLVALSFDGSILGRWMRAGTLQDASIFAPLDAWLGSTGEFVARDDSTRVHALAFDGESYLTLSSDLDEAPPQDVEMVRQIFATPSGNSAELPWQSDETSFR